MDKFERQIIESMKTSCIKRVNIPERDVMLLELDSLEAMTIGQSDRLFCNSFLSEMIRLLINSIFLYEDGYFDCAFYSIRQASEVGNGMLFLANKDKAEREKWNRKGYFPMNAKLEEQLSKIDKFYSEVKKVIPSFFQKHEELIKKAHKIVHKQGFDTFYSIRKSNAYNKNICLEDKVTFFVELLKHTIGFAIILYIVLNPLSLILAIPELSIQCNFDPMEEAEDISFFEEYLTIDTIKKIKSTNYFKDFSKYFEEKEKMLPAVFDVVRNQFFDIALLEDIKSQSHLISLYENIILELLLSGTMLTHIYPDCLFIGYYTSIKSNYYKAEWNSSEYDNYLNSEQSFNLTYHNVFISVIIGIERNWIIEHNEPLKDDEIDVVKNIMNDFKTMYQQILDSIKLDF